MSVAKTGSLPNAYKYVRIAVDSFDNRLLQGRIYHDSRSEGVGFGSLSELAIVLENMFDQLHYPMKSVNPRNFNRKSPVELSGEVLAEHFPVPADENRGLLADFSLHVKYRYFATWQGEIRDLRSGSIEMFSSFMELMDYLERTLGSRKEQDPYGLGKRMCEVAIRNYENHVMGGDVSHPAVHDRRPFINEFELKEQISAMLNPKPEGQEEERIIVPRTMQVFSGNFGPATFVVRVLFRRNATWQGTITWKEKHQQVSYRSFLEMLLLMQEAVNHSEGWKQEQTPEDEKIRMA